MIKDEDVGILCWKMWVSKQGIDLTKEGMNGKSADLAISDDKLLPIDCSWSSAICLSVKILDGEIRWIDFFSQVPGRRKRSELVNMDRNALVQCLHIHRETSQQTNQHSS